VLYIEAKCHLPRLHLEERSEIDIGIGDNLRHSTHPEAFKTASGLTTVGDATSSAKGISGDKRLTVKTVALGE